MCSSDLGELGLSGEVRSVGLLEQRLKEARRLGMTEAVVPASGKAENAAGMKIVQVRTLSEAVNWLMDKK